MLNNLAPADETRHHAHVRKYLGATGKILSTTQNDQQTFVLVELETESILVPAYHSFKPDQVETVRLGLGRQAITEDQRIIYQLIAYPHLDD